MLANQAAVAFANAALYRQVQRQAMRDGLTGLYNHRHFQERLAEEVRPRPALPPAPLAAHDRRRRLQAFQRRARPPARRRGAARGRRASCRRTCAAASTCRRATAARSSPWSCRTPTLGCGLPRARLHERLEDLDGELPPPGEGAMVVGERLREAVEGTALRGARRTPLRASHGQHRRRVPGRRPATRVSRRAAPTRRSSWPSAAARTASRCIGREDAAGQARRPRHGARVSAAVSASLDLEEVLSTIARRVTEAFDVWECDFYEYGPRTRRWWRGRCGRARSRTRTRRGSAGSCRFRARPTYAGMPGEGGIREIHLDDPDLDRGRPARDGGSGASRAILSVALAFNERADRRPHAGGEALAAAFRAGGARAARPARRARGRGDPQRPHVPP